MENFTLNQPKTLQFNKMNYSIWNFKVVLKILILFLVLLGFENSIAQTSSNTPNTKEINSFLSTLKTSSSSDFEKLDGLVHKLNPAVYAYDNTLKIFGQNSTVLYTDLASLNYIKNNSIPAANTIELIRIDIKKSSDLYGKIDLSMFSDFPNLKYIYIYSEIATNEMTLNQIFSNYDSKYSLIYSINQGE